MAFGAAIEPGLSLVGADISQSSTPLAEDVTAAVVRGARAARQSHYAKPVAANIARPAG